MVKINHEPTRRDTRLSIRGWTTQKTRATENSTNVLALASTRFEFPVAQSLRAVQKLIDKQLLHRVGSCAVNEGAVISGRYDMRVLCRGGASSRVKAFGCTIKCTAKTGEIERSRSRSRSPDSIQ